MVPAPPGPTPPPEALDLEMIDDHLGRLMRGETVQTPVYNFKTGARRTLPRPIYTLSPDGRYAPARSAAARRKSSAGPSVE